MEAIDEQEMLETEDKGLEGGSAAGKIAISQVMNLIKTLVVQEDRTHHYLLDDILIFIINRALLLYHIYNNLASSFASFYINF